MTRAGRREKGKYVGFGEGGTLHTQGEYDVNTTGLIKGFRVVLNTLGDGYVEAIPDGELRRLAEQ